MPRYTNNQIYNIEVLNSDNKRQTLKTGEATDTLEYYDTAIGLTKLSDEPFINILHEYNIETFVAPETRTLVLSSPDIAKVRIQKVTGIINIYLQSITNTPAVLMDWTADDFPIDIIIDGRADQIVIESINPIGSVQILEIKAR